MAIIQVRPTKEELEARGEALFRRRIEPSTTSEDEGKFVLIDVDSGDYEIDRSELAAEERLQVRRPGAQVWMLRIGSRCSRHIGPRPRRVHE